MVPHLEHEMITILVQIDSFCLLIKGKKGVCKKYPHDNDEYHRIEKHIGIK
jgi:hypothetical protein